MEKYLKPLPLADNDSQAFWESCKNHAMALQRCAGCKSFRYPPRSLCPHCHSPQAEWTPVSGKGRVYVTLEMCRSYGPAWQEDVPYNISMIELVEGVRMWSNVTACLPQEVRIGDPVTIVYDNVTDAVTLPRFCRAASG